MSDQIEDSRAFRRRRWRLLPRRGHPLDRGLSARLSSVRVSGHAVFPFTLASPPFIGCDLVQNVARIKRNPLSLTVRFPEPDCSTWATADGKSRIDHFGSFV